jgi:hypothetical protein
VFTKFEEQVETQVQYSYRFNARYGRHCVRNRHLVTQEEADVEQFPASRVSRNISEVGWYAFRGALISVECFVVIEREIFQRREGIALESRHRCSPRDHVSGRVVGICGNLLW